jgi:hypothetical protein
MFVRTHACIIFLRKFLDAHTVDTILTRTCRLWNQLVAENGSRLPAQQFTDVEIENRLGTGKTVRLKVEMQCKTYLEFIFSRTNQITV